MTSPLRILHITRNLPPLIGGMERLNWHIADELSRHAEVHVIGPTGAAQLRPPQVVLTEASLRPLWRFLLSSAWQAQRIARAWKPDVVLAGSGLTAPAAVAAARVVNARACVYLHGLDAAVKHPVYKALWHPAIRGMDTVIANSQPTAKLAQALGVTEQQLRIVHPGVHVPEAPQPTAAVQDFRHRHGLGDARILLSVGRLTERKGLREFVQNALPDIVRAAPDAMLVVVGDAPTDSLLAGVQTRASIQAVADAAGIGHSLRFIGMITDPVELACAYESATLHIFPVRELPGDPEGFGMVAIEAAAHGIPTVGFATGGIVDAVAEDQSGRLVSSGNYRALAQAALALMNKPTDKWRDKAATFAQSFAWPAFGDQLRAAIQGVPKTGCAQQ